jgi:hypothetical protein
MLRQSEMHGFESGAGCRQSVRNADTGQGPRWRIARRKSIDPRLGDFVGNRDRFNFSERPGVCPGLSDFDGAMS